MLTNGSSGLLEDSHAPSDPFLIFYFIIQTTLMVGGTIGNVLVLVAFLTNKKLLTNANIFILNLAAADLIVVALVLPFNVFGILKSHHFFSANTWLCEAIAFFCVTSCIAQLWSIMGISVNRYVYICKSKYYKQVFSRRNTVVMVFLVWVVSGLIDLPNFLDWGGNRYDMKTLVCSYDRTANYGWILFFVGTAVILPGFVDLFCYWSIVVYVRQHSMKVRHGQHVSSASRGSAGNSAPRLSQRQIQLLKMIVSIFAVFSVCWITYGVVVLLDFDDNLSQTTHVLVWIVAHASSTLDPLIYCMTNRQFRESFALACRCFRKTNSLSSHRFSSNSNLSRINFSRANLRRKRSNSRVIAWE